MYLLPNVCFRRTRTNLAYEIRLLRKVHPLALGTKITYKILVRIYIVRKRDILKMKRQVISRTTFFTDELLHFAHMDATEN